MQLAAFLFICVQAGLVLAQDITVTAYASTVTVLYNNPTTSTIPPTPTTLVTIASVQRMVASQVSAAAATTPTDQGTNTLDVEGGASGSQAGSFQISQGALIAIIVVCVFVVLLGAASTILFVVAKRRQWNVRASIARASRRVTGRFNGGKSSQREASRRTGTHFGSPQRPAVKAVLPPGHKRGLVVDVQPVEKRAGVLDGRAPANTRLKEQAWTKKLWGGSWK